MITIRKDELRSPSIRYDVMRNIVWPYRVASRVTLDEVERIASEMGARVMWEAAHRIGVTTVEVTLSKP